MKVKSESEVTQLCLTLSNPMYCSLPGSSIHGILQARVLEWGAIAFSTLGTRAEDSGREHLGINLEVSVQGELGGVKYLVNGCGVFSVGIG